MANGKKVGETPVGKSEGFAFDDAWGRSAVGFTVVVTSQRWSVASRHHRLQLPKGVASSAFLSQISDLSDYHTAMAALHHVSPSPANYPQTANITIKSARHTCCVVS